MIGVANPEPSHPESAGAIKGYLSGLSLHRFLWYAKLKKTLLSPLLNNRQTLKFNNQLTNVHEGTIDNFSIIVLTVPKNTLSFNLFFCVQEIILFPGNN